MGVPPFLNGKPATLEKTLMRAKIGVFALNKGLNRAQTGPKCAKKRLKGLNIAKGTTDPGIDCYDQ